MRSPFPGKLFPFVAMVFLLGLLTPATISADPGQPPESTGIRFPGVDPRQAITIVGIEVNELEPGQSLWYQTTSGGSSPFSVTLDYDSCNTPPPGTIQMRVDWKTPTGILAADWPGFYRLGEGTSSGLGPGVLYWLTSSQNPATYAIELVNNSTVPVGYAIALTGPDFPPPDLNPPPPVECLGPTE